MQERCSRRSGFSRCTTPLCGLYSFHGFLPCVMSNSQYTVNMRKTQGQQQDGWHA